VITPRRWFLEFLERHGYEEEIPVEEAAQKAFEEFPLAILAEYLPVFCRDEVRRAAGDLGMNRIRSGVYGWPEKLPNQEFKEWEHGMKKRHRYDTLRLREVSLAHSAQHVDEYESEEDASGEAQAS
jgi:hypothetical protein